MDTGYVRQVNPVEGMVKGFDRLSLPESEVTTLDEVAASLFARAAAGSENIKEQSYLAIQQGKLSPEELLELQQVVSSYNIDISLLSAIARKTVGAVETLLRS